MSGRALNCLQVGTCRVMAESATSVGELTVGRFKRPVGIEVELQPRKRASADAREALEVFEDSLPERAYADLRVVVTELVTNGVKYGPGGPIALSVALDRDGVVRGEVDDGGTGGVRMRAPGPLGGGLGLVIVEALTQWGVHPGSSHVWFELDAQMN
jgi:anti-sigma regulatory factor (Ser/Thr protein kinase)